MWAEYEKVQGTVKAQDQEVSTTVQNCLVLSETAQMCI